MSVHRTQLIPIVNVSTELSISGVRSVTHNQCQQEHSQYPYIYIYLYRYVCVCVYIEIYIDIYIDIYLL